MCELLIEGSKQEKLNSPVHLRMPWYIETIELEAIYLLVTSVSFVNRCEAQNLNHVG